VRRVLLFVQDCCAEDVYNLFRALQPKYFWKMCYKAMVVLKEVGIYKTALSRLLSPCLCPSLTNTLVLIKNRRAREALCDLEGYSIATNAMALLSIVEEEIIMYTKITEQYGIPRKCVLGFYVHLNAHTTTSQDYSVTITHHTYMPCTHKHTHNDRRECTSQYAHPHATHSAYVDYDTNKHSTQAHTHGNFTLVANKHATTAHKYHEHIQRDTTPMRTYVHIHAHKHIRSAGCARPRSRRVNSIVA